LAPNDTARTKETERTMKALTASMLALSLMACGGEDEEDDAASTAISTSPLTGSFGGMPWTIAAMETDSFFSDETSFSATAYAEAVTACEGTFAESPQLLTQLPRTPGDHPLGIEHELTVTFYFPATSENLIATEGHIRIDTVTETQITGGLQAQFDAANTLNGTFTATICP
jgi:hypothetical protein